MFDTLSGKFVDAFKNITGKRKITESNIEDTLKQVRTALLEADVNFKVVKNFIAAVREKAVGQKIVQGVDPGMQFIKIVQEELASVMGSENKELSLAGDIPLVVLVVGPNGQGKTTFCGKLANYLTDKKQKKVLLVPADTFRPAAKEQLVTLASRMQVECFDSNLKKSPEKIAVMALKDAKAKAKEVVIIDTAGRLHEDDELMKQLVKIKKSLKSFNLEVLMVADAMAGQEAVTMTSSFHQQVGIDGIVLSKMDSDARGGAALSISYVTKIPIYYISNGEQMRDLELFHPDRLAGRILDQGDVVSLVEKAEGEIDEKEAQQMMEKMEKGRFTMDDFLKQMGIISKLGSMGSLLKMLPGMGQIQQMGDLSAADTQLKQMKVMISSMTRQERNDHKIIEESRINRIAKGSGHSTRKVQEFLAKFSQMEKMMKGVKQGSGFPGFPMPGQKRKKKKSPWGNRYF